jgi:hypothetical protein
MTQSTTAHAGRFHQGRLSDGRPQALDAWRVTTDDADVAARVAGLLGGEPQPNGGGSGGRAYEVLTSRESVRVLLDGPDAVTAHLILWGSKGIVHQCDGMEFLSPEDKKGRPCGCPPLLADRKLAARNGRGPTPSVDITFQIAAAPELGTFHFMTSSWQMAAQLSGLADPLERVGGPAVCDLTMELIVYTAKTGGGICYRKPVVTVLGSPDRVAPEPTPAALGHLDGPDRRRPHRCRHRHTLRAAGRTPGLRRGPGDQRRGVGVAVQCRQCPPALDAGRTCEDITAGLAAVAAGPLPQPLSYLVADTARGHGRVRIAPASCVLHGDEPALLAELAAHRRLAKLGLRQLAPTVLISRSPLDTILAALRAEGYAPVAETAEGTVRIEEARPRRAGAAVPAPRGSRARGGGRIATGTAKESAAFDPSTLAIRLLAAPPAHEPAPLDGGAPFATDTEEIVAGWAKRLSYSDVRQLAHAIDAGQAITVEYVATSGNRTVRALSRLDLDPPFLEAWCHLRGAERVFTLSRIHSVMSVAPE